MRLSTTSLKLTGSKNRDAKPAKCVECRSIQPCYLAILLFDLLVLMHKQSMTAAFRQSIESKAGHEERTSKCQRERMRMLKFERGGEFARECRRKQRRKKVPGYKLLPRVPDSHCVSFFFLYQFEISNIISFL
jgi:hypothetical protein